MRLKSPMQNPSSPSWQRELFRYSFMKREKVALLLKHLPHRDRSYRVVDLGCRQGVVSLALSEKSGGSWVFADVDPRPLGEARKVLGDRIVLVGERLPFPDDSFDVVLCLDLLEHVVDDRLLMAEVARILKPSGRAYLSTPRSGGCLFPRLRRLFGLTPEVYGHVREGYSLEELRTLSQDAGLKVLFQGAYARFFTEAVETVLNILFHLKERGGSRDRTGKISPSDEGGWRGDSLLNRLYRAVYPLLRAVTLLDRLIPSRGHVTFLEVTKDVQPLPSSLH